jgi:hypothetical protein
MDTWRKRKRLHALKAASLAVHLARFLLSYASWPCLSARKLSCRSVSRPSKSSISAPDKTRLAKAAAPRRWTRACSLAKASKSMPTPKMVGCVSERDIQIAWLSTSDDAVRPSNAVIVTECL